MFYEGQTVFFRTKCISKDTIRKMREIYGKTLPIETWWEYCVGPQNDTEDTMIVKDINDDTSFYIVKTTYIGVIKKEASADVRNQKKFLYNDETAYEIKWEYRKDPNTIMPGMNYEMTNISFSSSIMSIDEMVIMSKEEILSEL